MTTAFQKDAFQNDAFQVDAVGVSLSLAATEGADTASASLALRISASLSATEGADLASASMAVGGAATLTLAATEGADLAAASVSLVALPATLTLDATEGADSASAAFSTPNLATTGGWEQVWHRRKRKDEPEEHEVPVAPVLVPVQRRPVAVKADPKKWISSPADRIPGPTAAPATVSAVPAQVARPVQDLQTRNRNHALRLLLLAS